VKFENMCIVGKMKQVSLLPWLSHFTPRILLDQHKMHRFHPLCSFDCPLFFKTYLYNHIPPPNHVTIHRNLIMSPWSWKQHIPPKRTYLGGIGCQIVNKICHRIGLLL